MLAQTRHERRLFQGHVEARLMSPSLAKNLQAGTSIIIIIIYTLI